MCRWAFFWVLLTAFAPVCIGRIADVYQLTNEQQLHFPLLWHGRLLTVSTSNGVPEAVERVFSGLQLGDGIVRRGQQSSSGKCQSWELQARLPDRPTMLALFAALEAIPGVKMLL